MISLYHFLLGSLLELHYPRHFVNALNNHVKDESFDVHQKRNYYFLFFIPSIKTTTTTTTNKQPQKDSIPSRGE